MNLKNIRKEKGLTLSEVANALKISTQDYRSLEEEKIEPSISQLKALIREKEAEFHKDKES